MFEGRLIPTSIVLSHPEQRARLAEACPEAVSAAVIAGDPCYDRIMASVPDRARYRRALDVGEHQKLIMVSSTWGENSLLAQRPSLVPELLAELPMDEYRVAVALHPNIWHGHSPWQVRSWLATSRRSGLILLPPRDGWRAALISADLVVGDHGSVCFYGASLGRPTLLAAHPQDALDPASPVAALIRTAPRLVPGRRLRPQIEEALTTHDPRTLAEITDCVTSVPGQSHRLLRREIYRLIKLLEPDAPPSARTVPSPDDAESSPVTAVLNTVQWTGTTAAIDRRPASVTVTRNDIADGRHLSVNDHERDSGLRSRADIIHTSDLTPDEVFRTYPGCFIAAIDSLDETLLQTKDGRSIRCHTAAPHLAASAVYAWLATGRSLADLPSPATVRTGAVSHPMTFTH